MKTLTHKVSTSLCAIAATTFLLACGEPLDGMSPAEQLAELDKRIAGHEEANAIGDPVGGWASPELAGLDALLDGASAIRLDTLKKQRADLLAANPGLVGATRTASRGGAGAVSAAALSVGSVAGSVTLSGRCGLPASAVTEVNRRGWYKEASSKIGAAFQTDASARAEINSISAPAGYSSVCEAAGAQVYAFLPSLNQAITASDKFHNGSPIGLRCGVGGASGSTACTAVSIVYGMKTTAFMCHHACNNNQ